MERPEVPTEHLHETIHHQAAHSGKRWTLGVALSSALLAGLAAVASMKAGHYANEAMMCEIQCSDNWNFYQSKSIKEAQLNSKVELLGALGKPMSEADLGKATKYATDKAEIKKKAEELEAESEKANEESEHAMHPHHKLAQAMTLIQIAISLASITVLTRKKWLFGVAAVSAAGGLVMWAFALAA
jgi:hypothetical protein